MIVKWENGGIPFYAEHKNNLREVSVLFAVMMIAFGGIPFIVDNGSSGDSIHAILLAVDAVFWGGAALFGFCAVVMALRAYRWGSAGISVKDMESLTKLLQAMSANSIVLPSELKSALQQATTNATLSIAVARISSLLGEAWNEQTKARLSDVLK